MTKRLVVLIALLLAAAAPSAQAQRSRGSHPIEFGIDGGVSFGLDNPSLTIVGLPVQNFRVGILMAVLKSHGVPTAIHYPQPVHTQPAYRDRIAHGAGGLAESERACREVLSLPMHPQLSDEAVIFTAQRINEWQP